MKIAVLVGDGMGDYPVEELGNLTPLQAARIPTIRRMAAAGRLHLVRTAPEGLELTAPGADGLRRDAPVGPKPAGTKRILVLGDSVVFGV